MVVKFPNHRPVKSGPQLTHDNATVTTKTGRINTAMIEGIPTIVFGRADKYQSNALGLDGDHAFGGLVATRLLSPTIAVAALRR